MTSQRNRQHRMAGRKEAIDRHLPLAAGAELRSSSYCQQEQLHQIKKLCTTHFLYVMSYNVIFGSIIHTYIS